jgi:Predicted amidohydrolase
MSTFIAAAIQMRSTTRMAENIEAMESLMREAAALGATYVQTPEMTGALMRDREALKASLRDENSDPVTNAAARLARELAIHVHLGSTAIDAGGGRIANRGFVFAPDGTRLARYDKIHMFDVDLDGGESWRESATYQPGETARLVDIGAARLGMSICYDVRFPHLYRDLAVAGAAVLTAPAAFTRQTGEAHWHVLQRARAIENGAFMISAAQGGRHEDGRETYGHSLIVDPWGRVLAEADGDEPGIVVAEIDPAESAAARARIPNLKNRRAYEIDDGAAEARRERVA